MKARRDVITQSTCKHMASCSRKHRSQHPPTARARRVTFANIDLHVLHVLHDLQNTHNFRRRYFQGYIPAHTHHLHSTTTFMDR